MARDTSKKANMEQQREAHAQELEQIAGECHESVGSKILSSIVPGALTGLCAFLATNVDNTPIQYLMASSAGVEGVWTLSLMAQGAQDYAQEKSLRIQARLIRKGHQSVPEPHNYNPEA
jgi:hypothetical protein